MVATSPVRLGEYKETVPGDFKAPDEDFYVAALDSWDNPVQSSYQDKSTGEFPWRINLKFKIVADLQGDTEFADCDCSGFFDLDLNPNAKGSILHVLTALDPTEEPTPGSPIEPYKGKQCIIEVVHKKKASKTDPTKILTFANIGGIKPLKKKNKPAAVAADPPAPKRNPLLDEDE